MNGLLRHSSNIHIGLFRSSRRWQFLGTIYNNIKGAYVFTTGALSSAGNTVIGYIQNIKL
jgi:hypothetical protein